MNIYLHPSGVKKELKNDYIGEVWTPWANTVAYFPFTNNQNDSVGWYSIDKTLTKDTIWYSFTQSWGNIWISGWLQKSAKFVWIWFNIKSWSWIIWFLWNNQLWAVQYRIRHSVSSYNKKIHIYTWSNYDLQASLDWDASYNQWHYFAYSLVGTNFYVCRDGVVTTLISSTPYYYDLGQSLCNFWGGTSCNIEVSERIIEDIWWSSQNMTNYYNATKSNYWL
jgi:hypothetical protein